DGSIFADFHFFDREGVIGVDAVRWPRHGWLVTATGEGRAATALLLDRGFRGFGDRMIDAGGPHAVLAPAVAAAGTAGASRAAAGPAGACSAYVGGGRGAATAAAAEPRPWGTFRRDAGARAWPAPVAGGPGLAGDGGAWPRPRIDRLRPARARVAAGATSGVI